jgi:hypothetical protein
MPEIELGRLRSELSFDDLLRNQGPLIPESFFVSSSPKSEHELMYGHWIGTTVAFRPSIRFEHMTGLRTMPVSARASSHSQWM